MTPAKFKLCPACGEHNPPALLECKECETDLTGVEVVDDAILAARNDATQGAATSRDDKGLVKLCDCGAENAPQARKCSSCGEDISDVRATEREAVAKPPSSPVVLRAFDGSFSFAVTKPVTIIGRECEMGEYLKDKTYVSRKHAKVTVVEGEVYIENLSGTNRTFVNDAAIPSDAPTLLKNGDEVGLGGKSMNGERQTRAAYFVIEA
ncbi:MAG: FHA domain-containing protein [Clostridiales Family XIII bacterium]|jgi:ribosomal protein L40E|nr:FHA domain-containing protein [Clostridiales Family XIII bacterium]